MLKTKQLVFSAMALALATIISNFKLLHLPYGGSITIFSMLIVCLVGYWYGPVTGITAAVAYGILQLIIDPYALHPIQVLLDYPLAFGALGLSGFFHQKKNGLIIGYLAGVCGRFVFAMISGLIFFTSYVDNIEETMMNVWLSTAYNLSYIVPEAVITIILLAIPAVRAMLNRLKVMAE